MLRHEMFVVCLILSYAFHNNLAAYLSADSQDLRGDIAQMKVSLWKVVRSWWKEEKKLLKVIKILGIIQDKKRSMFKAEGFFFKNLYDT